MDDERRAHGSTFCDEHPSEYRDLMGEDRSPELDQVRQLLFPRLSAEDGWARIDAAISGASDPERAARIEQLAGAELSSDLLAILRRLHADEGTD